MTETGASLLEVLIALLLLSIALTAMQHLTLATLQLTQSRTRAFNAELKKQKTAPYLEQCLLSLDTPISVYECQTAKNITRRLLSYDQR